LALSTEPKHLKYSSYKKKLPTKNYPIESYHQLKCFGNYLLSKFWGLLKSSVLRGILKKNQPKMDICL
jgi:hypothetical protein